MKLAVGQVWKDAKGNRVVVLQVRGEEHPRGLGRGYGDSAIAVPVDRLSVHPRGLIDPELVHPFDAYILCGSLPSHGPAKWESDDGIHYVEQPNGIFFLKTGPHPVRGDE